MPAYSA